MLYENIGREEEAFIAEVVGGGDDEVLSLGGADARYIGVADERAFSTLDIRSRLADSHVHVLGQGDIPVTAHFDPSSPSANVPFSNMTAHLALSPPSQRLTPLRHSSLGRSSSRTAQLHLNASLDKDCYQRLLTKVLLGSAEGRTGAGVLCFPTRTPPLARNSSQRVTPITSGIPDATSPLFKFQAPPEEATLSPLLQLRGSTVFSSVAGEEVVDEAAAAPQTQAKEYASESWDPSAACTPVARSLPLSTPLMDEVRDGWAATGRATMGDEEDSGKLTAPVVYFQRAPSVWSARPSAPARWPRPPTSEIDADELGKGSPALCGLHRRVARCASSPGSPYFIDDTSRTRPPAHPAAAATVAAAHAISPVSKSLEDVTWSDREGGGWATPSSRCVEKVGSPISEVPGLTTSLRLARPTAGPFCFDTPPTAAAQRAVPPRHSYGFTVSRSFDDGGAFSEGEAAGAEFVLPAADKNRDSGSCAEFLSTPSSDPFTPVQTTSAGSFQRRWVYGAPPMQPPHVAVGASDRSSPSCAPPGRHLVTPQCLSTPVRHRENSLRSTSTAVIHTNASVRGTLVVPSVSCWRVASPADMSASYAALSSAHRHHLSPALELVGGRSDGAGYGGVGRHRHENAGGSGANAAVRQRYDRDAFQFMRALTASSVSTDVRHSPLMWGCFGILVAQSGEVWCVGKAQPFCLFPSPVERSADVLSVTELEVTAVAATERLTSTQWQSASVAPTAFGDAPAVAYAAIGTSDGDVIVYGYRRCSPSAPGAIPVSLVDEEPQSLNSHAVLLRQRGIIRYTSRTGTESCPVMPSPDGVPPLTHGNQGVSLPSTKRRRDCTVSALLFVDHWLYIGDQAGHVSRYNLRQATFLQSLTPSHAELREENASAHATPCPAKPSGRKSVAVEDLTRESWENPSLTSPDGAAEMTTVGATLLQTSALSCTPPSRAFRTPVLEIPRSTAAAEPLRLLGGFTDRFSTGYHYSTYVGEEVYRLAVSEHHSHIAVGTKSRLLVYKMSQLSRMSDAAATPATTASFSLSSLSHPHAILFSSTSSIAPARASGPLSPDGHPAPDPNDSTAPMIVVSDAAEPVRNFAWMHCDYEALSQSASMHLLSPKLPFRSADRGGGGGDEGCSDMLSSGEETLAGIDRSPRLGPMGKNLGSVDGCQKSSPSLVFATARRDTVEGAAAGFQGESRMKTDIRVVHVATHTTVTSCTLDYPVRLLAVLPGTPRIIVATGGAVESVYSGTLSPLSDTSLRWSLERPSTSPALRTPSTPATTMTTTPSTLAHGPSSPVLIGRLPTPILTAAGMILHHHHPLAARSSQRGRGATDGASPTAQPPPAPTPEQKKGYLFNLELCPAGDTTLTGAGENSCLMSLRVRGELSIGDSESAVCGTLSPHLDQLSVLVRPTACPTRGVTEAFVSATPINESSRVKVKVWRMASYTSPASATASIRTRGFSSEMSSTTSLR